MPLPYSIIIAMAAAPKPKPKPKPKKEPTERKKGAGKRKAPAGPTTSQDFADKRAKMAASTGEEEIPDIDEYLVQPEKPMDSRLMQQVHASQGFFTAADLPDSDSDSD